MCSNREVLLDHDVPGEVARVLRYEGYEVAEFRQVLAVRASDVEVFNYARENGLILITCYRDDFLSLAAERSNPGIVFLVRRRSRHVECGHLLTFLKRAGASGMTRNINFA
jgi:predicted nuclease of predicted toxin-antitoxin system